MSVILEEKELKDSLSKCRCCFRLIIDDRRAVDIDDTIREQFFNLCQLILLKHEILAERICQLCACDLKSFANLRADLIEKQNNLYALSGIEVTSAENEEEAIAILVEDTANQDCSKEEEEKLQYEIVEEGTEEVNEDLWEEASIDDTASSYYGNEEDESMNSVLKIEKINRKRSRDELVEEHITVEEYFEVYETGPSGEDTTLDEEQIECNLCLVKVLQSQFDYHVELMHVDDLKCDKCEEVFQSKILLRRHDIDNHYKGTTKRGTKNRRRVYFCGLCDKEYEYKKYLDDHVRSFHKKERNRQCPICHRCFYHRDIKKHIEHVHGEKRISCKVCGKLYTCLENLKLHMRYHEDPKFICNVGNCGKKFHQKILWEHHKLKHSTEKPIVCNECGNFFYTVRDLKRHTQRVHTKVLRKCFGCETTFHRKDKYREHVIKHHKELTEEERSTMLDNIRALKWNET